MVSPDPTSQGAAALPGEHNLPMLRVHRAWEAAERIAKKRKVPPSVALEVAREVIDIIGDGTRRWGHLCISCRSLMAPDDEGQPTCPKHGRATWLGPSTVLLISFDPLPSAVSS